MVTQLPSKKPSLRLIQPFRWEQPACRLSSWKLTLPGSHTLLKCTQMPEVQLPPALILLVQYLQVLLPCNVRHTKVLFPPKSEAGQNLALTTEITKACTQTLPCTLFSAGSSSLPTWNKPHRPTNWASKKMENWEPADCTCFEALLLCEVPPHHPVRRTIHYFSDLFF